MVALLLACCLGQLVPDPHPVTVVLVDLLPADLHGDIAEQGQAERLDPLGRAGQGGDVRLEVGARDQVTIAADRARDALAEVGKAIEGLLDGLEGEVSVPAVHNFEEGDLRVAGEVDVLQMSVARFRAAF